MKTINSLLTGVALAVVTLTLAGQAADTPTPTAPPCCLGQCAGGGPGRNLTPEQRAERQKTMQAYVATLQEKKANNTLTSQEADWLERAEELGGLRINGVPRGPRGGFGAQGMNGQGRGRGGMGRGWCGGRGAGNNPNCPLNPQ